MTYSPVLFLHPDEGYFPKSIDSMLNESNLTEYINSTNREVRDPQPVDVNNLSSPPANADYYMDMAAAAPGIKNYTAPDSSRFNPYPETVYGRVMTVSNHKVLQYWIVYPWNDWHNKHEGDWEMIQIWMDSNGVDVPQRATYFYHLWRYAVDWAGADMTMIGPHPAAYIGSGSHASYTAKNASNILPGDSVSDDGTILSHENTVSYLIGQGYTNNRSTYELVKINDSTIWVDFPGRWGYYDPNSTIYKIFGLNGPTGPGAKDQWSHPENYLDTDLPGPDLTWAQTGSPVNLHAYDSQGRHVGLNATGDVEMEIPGAYAYGPSDNGTETMIILTDEELTYVVEATGEGEFNLTVDRGLQNVRYIADYYDVNITSDSTSNLDVSEANPEFIMEVDYDGDGTSDYVKYPNRLK